MQDFCQFFLTLTVVICFAVFAGCGLPAMPSREPITFDYAPTAEAAAGSAEVTFIIVGAQLAKPVQQNSGQASQVQSPLFNDFASGMTNDFMEVLNARGFGVTGPYKTYNEIVHPVKEGNDLILTAEVNLTTQMQDIRLGKLHVGKSLFDTTRYRTLVGSVTVICDVKLLLSETLTNEPMWTKNVTLDPFVVEMDSAYPFYSEEELISLAVQYGQVSVPPGGSVTGRTYRTRVFPNCPISLFLEKDSKFHSNFGRALKTQYREILHVVYTYLDPREMAIVKNQAMELKKRKVY